MTVRYLVGDVRAVLATLPAASVDLVVTSPPFLAVRSYLPADHPDKALEMGSEPTPAAYLDGLLDVVGACGRVLAPHGSLVFELGDTYSGSGGAGGDYADDGLREGQPAFKGSASKQRSGWHRSGKEDVERYRALGAVDSGSPNGGFGWPLAKSKCLIPELFAGSLAYGYNLAGPTDPAWVYRPSVAGRWRVRNQIAWCRTNPPVGALGDKWRPGHSSITVACRNTDRYWDDIATRTAIDENAGKRAGTHNKGAKSRALRPELDAWTPEQSPAGAPLLDWWVINNDGFSGSHYATFPPELCVPLIEAMCPRRVCRTCGLPSRRIVETEYTPHGDPAKHNAEPKAAADYPLQMRQQNAQGMANGRADKHSITLGWSSCGCPGTDGLRLDGHHTGTGWRPGLVLDPYAGTATTLQVAHGHGRDSIGIDLDDRNLEHARTRLGMFLTEPERVA